MAIQVGGTTVINNSKQLVGITGADTTTKNALVAAGVGGGFVTQSSLTTIDNTHSSFTKPADGHNVKDDYQGSVPTSYQSGTVSSSYKVLSAPALTSGRIGYVSYYVNGTATNNRPGGYPGSTIAFAVYNSTNNNSYIIGIYGSWNNLTSFPYTFKTNSLAFIPGDKFEIWASDSYTWADANENLTFAANSCSVSAEWLQV